MMGRGAGPRSALRAGLSEPVESAAKRAPSRRSAPGGCGLMYCERWNRIPGHSSVSSILVHFGGLSMTKNQSRSLVTVLAIAVAAGTWACSPAPAPNEDEGGEGGTEAGGSGGKASGTGGKGGS